ncbi:Axonemal dynein light chain domain-containing protein 1 [Globomyces sp. JEL0801]|nr:Axonemal dynein light chain domain-containing protein 1 [Globomyces sp. JEL0801]
MSFIPASLLEDVSRLKNGQTKTRSKRNLTDLSTPKKSSEVNPTLKNMTASRLKPKSKENETDIRQILTPHTIKKKDLAEVLAPTTRAAEPILQFVETKPIEDTNMITNLIKTPAIPVETNDYNHAMKVITTRKEVAQLRNTMRELLQDLGVQDEKDYPSEMDLFIKIIREENKIYNSVFQEIIRQVTINMIERGELLNELRDRYSTMFNKIPDHVINIHTELIAHRKLNKRLSEELIRAKEHIGELLKELDFVREHDAVVNVQAHEAQERMVSMMNNAESAEESMEEFHKLYKMQRSRLETQLHNSEKEKRLWVDAATNLALRIGQEYGISDLLLLLRYEDGRLRVTNHMVVNISDSNSNELEAIETKIDEWRGKLLQISKSIVEEDYHSVDVVSKIQRNMRKVLKNLITNEPENAIELDHKLLNGFHLFDIHSLMEDFQFWITQIQLVTIRFTSGKDAVIREEISAIRRMTNTWVESGIKLIRRSEDSINGQEYVPFNESIKNLHGSILDWLVKLEARASGEDGVANGMLMVLNQLEDSELCENWIYVGKKLLDSELNRGKGTHPKARNRESKVRERRESNHKKMEAKEARSIVNESSIASNK